MPRKENIGEYIKALKSIKLPPRKPQEEELDEERLYVLVHGVTEAMQKLKEKSG